MGLPERFRLFQTEIVSAVEREGFRFVIIELFGMLELLRRGEFSFADEISVLVPYVAILMQTLAEAVEEAGKLGRVEVLLDCERQALAERAFLGHNVIYYLVTRLAAETIKENCREGDVRKNAHKWNANHY